MNIEQVYDSIGEFLATVIHCLFYNENVYPKISFKAVRQYETATWQSCHPGVCEWVETAVATVIETLKTARTKYIAFVISHNGQISYRYGLDTAHLPMATASIDAIDPTIMAEQYRACIVNLLSMPTETSAATLAIVINAEPNARLAGPDSAFIVTDSQEQAQWPINVGTVEPIRFIDAGTFGMSMWRQRINAKSQD